MIVLIFVVFQFLAILFYGIFARSNSTAATVTSYSTLVNNCLMLLLSFTLMYAPYRKFSLFSLGSLLFVTVITVQTYFLFATFWDSCFDGFNSTFTIDPTLITRSLHASLLVLLTSLDFLGLFCYWQVYLILSPMMIIGATLSSAILIRGLNVFDGGSGLLVFFYSGVFSFMIWLVLLKDKPHLQNIRIKKSYLNQVLGVLGVIIAFMNWPKFNAAGALVSHVNVDTNSVSVVSLQNSAIGNTLMSLSVSVLIAYLFSEKEGQKKMKYSNFVDCFVNGGISIASFQDIALNPVACIIISGLSSAITLLIDSKFLSETDKPSDQNPVIKMMKSHGRILYRIAFPFLGIIICSIVVATRSGQTPNLINNTYSKIAGLQIVGFLIVLVFAALFGLGTAFIIKGFINIKDSKQRQEKGSEKKQWIQTDKNPDEISKELEKHKLEIEDNNYFLDIQDEIYPLYYDMFGNIKQVQKDVKLAIKTGSQIKDALIKNQVSPHHVEKLQQSMIKPDGAQQPKITISHSFTKDNESKDVDLSAMKFVRNEMAYEEPASKVEKDEGAPVMDDQIPDMMMNTNVPKPLIRKGDAEKKGIQPIKEEESQIKDDECDQIRQSGMISLKNNLLITKSNQKPLTNSHARIERGQDKNDLAESRIDVRVSKAPQQH